MKKQNKITLAVCGGSFAANLALFLVKLYVGLSSNSISIYSDAVNSLFDSLSGLITFLCLAYILKTVSKSNAIIKKTEQLLSFIMSIVVVFVGFYFAYSSLERLMYPTPVWYLTKFLVLISLTAVVKLILFFVFREVSKKAGSPVIRVMAFDSLLDFFITCSTILSLTLSQYVNFALDAVFGIVISVMIIVSAVKLMISRAAFLINFVSIQKRKAVESIINSCNAVDKCFDISYILNGESTLAYAKIRFANGMSESDIQDATEAMVLECREKENVELNIVIQNRGIKS